MRFIHTADIHLGATPDKGMPWSDERKQALWTTFRKIIDITDSQGADLLLIAGDLFHRQPKQSECKEVNSLFRKIPDTRIVLIAGNHDYICGSSPYESFDWAENVTILSSATMDSVYFPDLNTEVHGFSYHRREIPEPLYDEVKAPDDGRIHILLAHGGDDSHIPINIRRLSQAGFDYVALGHIHQPTVYKLPIAYCGSPEPLDKTETRQHGYIIGDIDEKGCTYRFASCSAWQYRCLSYPVDRESTTMSLIDVLSRQIRPDGRILYRLTLTGRRDPVISFDTDLIQREGGRIVDVVDETEPDYDLEKLQAEHEYDLVSYYIRELTGPETTSLEKNALYYGLRALLNPE